MDKNTKAKPAGRTKSQVARVKPIATPAYFRSDAVQQSLEQWLKNPTERRAFTASLIGVLSAQPALQACDPATIVSSAITAVSLDLPITSGLGYAGIVPYNCKEKDPATGRDVWRVKAQFQLMAKGYKQLALRSGEYLKINDTDVREGEYTGQDRMTGDHKFSWIDDEKTRNSKPVTGYLAYLQLRSGFSKTLYMTIEDLEKHAKRFSKVYAKSGGGLWGDKKDGGFDAMARKTVLKLLISRHGITSSSLQKALIADQAELDADDAKYLDNKDGHESLATVALPPATPPKEVPDATREDTKSEPAPKAIESNKQAE